MITIKLFKNISIIIFLFAIGFFVYNFALRPSVKVNITNSVPNHSLDAKLLKGILSDSIGLSGITSEEIIEFKGVIKEINYLNNRTNILLPLDADSNTFVICDMQSNQRQKLTSYKAHDTITIKGIYKGVLKDVVLLNCVISK